MSAKESSEALHLVEECSIQESHNIRSRTGEKRLSLRKAFTSNDRSANGQNDVISRDQSLQPDNIFKDLLNKDLSGRLVIDLNQIRRGKTSNLVKTGPLDVSGFSSQSRAVSVRSILLNRNVGNSTRELSRKDTSSPKKKVVFAKNKMVMLFEKDPPTKPSR